MYNCLYSHMNKYAHRKLTGIQRKASGTNVPTARHKFKL